MSYGLWSAILCTEMMFSAPHWSLKAIGAVASFAGLFMMAGHTKTVDKVYKTLLEIGRELLRRK